MLRICALSGEEVATFQADELRGKRVKDLKMQLAQRLGVSRFRQRWFASDHEISDEESLEMLSESDVQLLILDFKASEVGQGQKLIAASEANSLDEVEALLRWPLTFDAINSVDDFGWTALHTAARMGHLECLDLLLEAGADPDKVRTCRGVNRPMSCRTTALHVAAQSGHLEILRHLLQAGADKDKVGAFETTALHWAAQNGHLQMVQLLLDVGAEKDHVSVPGTPLHLAVKNGHLEVAKLLLEAQADKDKVGKDGQSVLHSAAFHGHVEIVRLLLESGDKTDKARPPDGSTALHLAAGHGHVEVVELLLDAGANPSLASKEGTALYVAAKFGQLEVVKLLRHWDS